MLHSNQTPDAQRPTSGSAVVSRNAEQLPTQRVLTNAQARAYLGGMSARSFYTFCQAYQVPVIRLLPQTCRYDIRDLDAALAQARSNSITKKEGN